MVFNSFPSLPAPKSIQCSLHVVNGWSYVHCYSSLGIAVGTLFLPSKEVYQQYISYKYRSHECNFCHELTLFVCGVWPP